MLTAAGLAETLLDRFAGYDDRTAICYNGEEVSYAELRNRILVAAREIGPSPAGQRVMIVEPDPLAGLIAMLAVWQVGASAVLISAQMPPSKIAHYARLTFPILGIGAAVDPALMAANRSANIAADDECLVLATSGTSGRPKLAALSAGNIEINLRVRSAVLKITESDRTLVNGPIASSGILFGQALIGLWSGAAISLFQIPAVAATILRESRKRKITVIQATTSAHMLYQKYWNGEPFEHVRLASQGGEPANQSLLTWLRAAYPNARLTGRYGMTEVGPFSYVDLEDPRALNGYLGEPFPHNKWHLKMDAAANTERIGPLCIAGPNVFLGYVQPQGGYKGLDDDGFFQTEDIFYLDPAGDLYFRGRANRAFKCGGRFVNPEQIESALNCIDGVHDAVCRAESHEILGRVPIAYVEPEPDAHISESDLMEACANDLEAHQVPRQIKIVSGFNLGPTGKKIIR